MADFVPQTSKISEIQHCIPVNVTHQYHQKPHMNTPPFCSSITWNNIALKYEL